MASKFGFGRQPSIALNYGKILEEDKMYFNDIIAAVKFQYDIVGFFSFEEIFNSRLKLYNRKNYSPKFIYPEKNILDQSFSLKIKESLENSNEFIGIRETSQNKEIFLKDYMDALEFFNVKDTVTKNMSDVMFPKFENIMIKGMGLTDQGSDINGVPILKDKEKIPKDYLLSDENFENTNKYDKRKRIFYLRVFNCKKNNIGTGKKCYNLGGLVNPSDLKKFYISFLRGRENSYSNNFFTTGQIPRISLPSFLIKTLQLKENTKIDTGVLCYEYDETKEDCCLVPNIVIDSKFNKITEINRKLERGGEEGFFSFIYDPKLRLRICSSNNFETGDIVIGYLDEGIYKSLGKDILEKKYSDERDIFVKKVSTGNLTSLKKDYPRPSLSLIVFREGSTFVPFSGKVPMSIDYMEGFFNTILYTSVERVNRPSFKNFRKKLITELTEFVTLYYYENMTIENNKTGIYVFKLLKMDEIFKYIQKKKNIDKILDYYKKYYTKDNIRTLISSIMKSDNFYSNLSNLFSNPIILYGDETDNEFPILRYISYFINCEKAEQCEKIIRAGDPESSDNQNFTFPYLKLKNSDKYIMYYNRALEVFNDTEI